MKLLAQSTVNYVDDNDSAWRFRLSTMSVLSQAMYEQLYLGAARDWYMAAMEGLRPEEVLGARSERIRNKIEHNREQQYQYGLVERVYAWAMILGSLSLIEMKAHDADVFVEVEIPVDWKTVDGMMETIKRDLFDELSIQSYGLNPHMLIEVSEGEKKRGVIRFGSSTNSSPPLSQASAKTKTKNPRPPKK